MFFFFVLIQDYWWNSLLVDFADADYQPEPFDFLIDGEFVRMSLEQFLLAKGISAVILSKRLQILFYLSLQLYDRLYDRKSVWQKVKMHIGFMCVRECDFFLIEIEDAHWCLCLFDNIRL